MASPFFPFFKILVASHYQQDSVLFLPGTHLFSLGKANGKSWSYFEGTGRNCDGRMTSRSGGAALVFLVLGGTRARNAREISPFTHLQYEFTNLPFRGVRRAFKPFLLCV